MKTYTAIITIYTTGSNTTTITATCTATSTSEAQRQFQALYPNAKNISGVREM